jgi:hypothetical protein
MMAHLGWFFAGTSFGLFVGVLLTSLAKISEMLSGNEDRCVAEAQAHTREAKLMLVRRSQS